MVKKNDGIGRVCIASRGKNRKILMKFGVLQQILNSIKLNLTKRLNF